MGGLICLLTPVGCAATSVAKATLGDVFDALTNWVLSSVSWLLSATGRVLSSASESQTVVHAANQEFSVLLVLSPILLLVGLLTSTLQALHRGDVSSLWRTYFVVAPACVAAIFLARPLTVLVLDSINQLSSTASATVTQHEPALATALTNLTPNAPGFGLFLLAVGVVVGCWLLWCELIVRTVVLTLLLVLVPVVVPLAAFPSLRRVGWRLAETFLAVASSKFLIVVVLSLGFSELLGTSATQVVTGAVTLVLATATPFLLLRIIPFVEQSALHNLEGLRQRATRAVQQAPSSPVGAAVQSLIPDAPVPGPEERPADLGFGMWESEGDLELAPTNDEPVVAPIGQARQRGGHVAYFKDDLGPVVGWHFDE